MAEAHMDAESGAATQDWMGLQRSLLQLRMEIAEATDPDERAELVGRLRETRVTIAELEKREYEPAPEAETESVPEPELEPEAELEPELEPESQLEPESELEAEPESQLEPQSEFEPEPEFEPAGAEDPELVPEPAITGTFTGAGAGAGDRRSSTGTNDEAGPERRWPLVLAAAAVVVAVVGIGAIALPRSSETGTATLGSDTTFGNTAQDNTAQDDTALGSTALDDTATGEAGDDGATILGDASSDLANQQPRLRVSLYDHRFTSQGDVPDQQTVAAIEQASAAAFGDRSDVSIKIDDALDSPPWLAAAPSLANQLLLLIDGEIIVTGEETVLSGRATRRDRDRIVANLEAAGFPNVSVYVDVVAPNPVELTARVEGETVSLSGTVPDEATASAIVGDLIAAFGQTNVNVDFEIDDTKVARSAVAGFGADVAALRNFPNVVVSLDNNSLYAVLDDGLEFEPGESELDPVAARNLQSLLPLLLRTTAPISIDGYTDNSGDHDRNHELSGLRAENVAKALVDGGVDPARISFNGLGDSNPIASNATAEGRARNRRIVVAVS